MILNTLTFGKQILDTSTHDSSKLGIPVYEELTRYPGNPIFESIFFYSLVLAGVAVVLALLCTYHIDKRYKWFEKQANKLLTWAFFFVWLFGVGVYDVGMYTGEPMSLLGNLLMAIIHSFGMFILESDVSAIHGPFHNNWWYMSAFSLAHFMAALVSLVFVLKHFGYNIIAAYRRWCIGKPREQLYVFWGMNDATYHLAGDTKRWHAEKGDGSYRIVVVRTNHDADEETAKNGMERLFNFLSLKNKDLDRLKDLDCITTNSYANLSSTAAAKQTGALSLLKKELCLHSLCKIIGRTTKTLHLFFLSDNEAANIQAVANLRRDGEIQAFAQRGKVVMYCHARYNSIHRVIEDEQTVPNIEVKVVDSSHICVELMKKNADLHPVNYVDVEGDATISSPFNALVVGFGEVGLDTVRFLYEFGAFVKRGAHGAVRSDFHCHVVDQNMDKLAGLFCHNAPSIVTTLNQKTTGYGKMINLYTMDCRSVEFYERLEQWINTLNYIVLATGDDETNISLAVRVLRLAISKRQDGLRKFRILVRVQHDENHHLEKIAQHYNRLWAAEQEASGDRLHQRVVAGTSPVACPITLFGAAARVYTYANVVSEQLKDDAKRFKNRYDRSVNVLRKAAGEKPYDIVSWDEEQNELMQLTGENQGYSPTYSGIMKLRRIQSQNIANSLHAETKIRLAKAALGQKRYDEMQAHGLERKDGTLTYSWRDRSNLPIADIQQAMTVLAQTEHLRWNASHEILGYQMGKDDDGFKDEARLLHGCLKEWEKLETITKSYDYNIVDVSLNLIDIKEKKQAGANN